MQQITKVTFLDYSNGELLVEDGSKIEFTHEDCVLRVENDYIEIHREGIRFLTYEKLLEVFEFHCYTLDEDLKFDLFWGVHGVHISSLSNDKKVKDACKRMFEMMDELR